MFSKSISDNEAKKQYDYDEDDVSDEANTPHDQSGSDVIALNDTSESEPGNEETPA